MQIFEILLLAFVVAIAGIVFLLVIASVFAFIGAMNMPEDINDEVPGDRIDKTRL